MANRKVNHLYFLLLFFVQFSYAAIEVDVSQISINFGSQINSFLQSCYGVDLDFFLQVATSNYSQEIPYILRQVDATSNTINFSGTGSFIIPSPTDFTSLTAILSMRCSIAQNVSDSFLLQSRTSNQPDRNNKDVPIQVNSNSNQWTLTATINRKCNGANEYGFNCNEQCSPVNNDYYCYTCGSNGQKICCGDVNQDDCSYYNHPVSTTWSPNLQCSTSAENTYFWLMISFAIIMGILAVFLLIAFLEICCGVITGLCGPRGSEDGDWIVPKEPKANHELYDADINRRHEYRRRMQQESRASSVPEEIVPAYTISRQGLDNETYNDEALRNEFHESQPRRIARV